MPERLEETATETDSGRRGFLGKLIGGGMAALLVAAYGYFATALGRFVYPAKGKPLDWLFVATLDRLKPGDAIDFQTPSGARLVIARLGEGESAEDFSALSSVCPHLGCRVHWEAANDRFFCPCHNGAFDRQGVATSGPPQAAGQSLARFPLKVENGLLYLQAPSTSLFAQAEASQVPGEGAGQQALAGCLRNRGAQDQAQRIV